MHRKSQHTALCPLVLAIVLVPATAALAHDPPYTQELDREGCTFTSVGDNPWFPFWPGYVQVFAGEEEGDEGTVELDLEITVTTETELVDGVETRVVEERESEDDELVEMSRNFFATCRETGAVWYFGEEVDLYEDGEVVGHEGSWRAGEDDAQAGLFMPGTPLIGARFYQELAPGVAEDRSEILEIESEVTVPFGSFDDALHVRDTNALDPEEPGDEKYYVPGVGLVKDEELELEEVELPDCIQDATTLCLNDGRFEVKVERSDFDDHSAAAEGRRISDDSGELWFFRPDNVEMLIKVLDGCPVNGRYWVFVAGLTNVEVDVTVTDTESDEEWTRHNPLGAPFQPILDTEAFETCP